MTRSASSKALLGLEHQLAGVEGVVRLLEVGPSLPVVVVGVAFVVDRVLQAERVPLEYRWPAAAPAFLGRLLAGNSLGHVAIGDLQLAVDLVDLGRVCRDFARSAGVSRIWRSSSVSAARFSVSTILAHARQHGVELGQSGRRLLFPAAAACPTAILTPVECSMTVLPN